MFATGETVGLVEWIIDDTWLVCFVLVHFEKRGGTDGSTNARTYRRNMCEYNDHYRPELVDQ